MLLFFHFLQVMLNKEKEGRQLMSIQAASLDLSVESSRKSRATGVTVQSGMAMTPAVAFSSKL